MPCTSAVRDSTSTPSTPVRALVSSRVVSAAAPAPNRNRFDDFFPSRTRAPGGNARYLPMRSFTAAACASGDTAGGDTDDPATVMTGTLVGERMLPNRSDRAFVTGVAQARHKMYGSSNPQ